MFEIHYDLMKVVGPSGMGVLTPRTKSQRTILTSFPPNTPEYPRKCFMSNTMICKKSSRIGAAIRVCDHRIAKHFR